MANPRMTLRDAAWSLLFMAIFLPLMVGCLIALFELGGPTLANPPNAIMKGLGGGAVVTTILLSWLLSLVPFGLLTRLFLSVESYDRWRRQAANAAPKVPALSSPLSKCFFAIVKPRRTKDAL